MIQSAERDGARCGKTIGVLHAGNQAAGAYRHIGYKNYCIGIDLHLVK